MRAAVVRSFTHVGVETVPIPAVEPGGLLVRTAACGICSGDVMPWYIERKAPLVLGHEMAGTVVAAGEGAPFAPGDRVFAHHHAPCLRCPHCAAGRYVHCAEWKKPAVAPGGAAEFYAVNANGARHDCLPLPPDLPWDAACLIEPLACAVKALSRVAPAAVRGAAVVLGLGPMGLLLVALLRHHGARSILAVDRVPYRLDLARRLGADAVLDFTRDTPPARAADLVIVGPPHVEAMRQGLALAAPGGTVLFFSPADPGSEFSFDPNPVYFDEITLVPSYSAGPPDTRAALDLLAAGAIDVAALISHRFPLDRVADAYRLVAAGGDSAKVLLDFAL